MSPSATAGATLVQLDEPTRALVRLSATLAGGTEEAVRAAMHDASDITSHDWIEELLLQTYLFAGFPRALNGMREWRRLHGRPPRSEASRNPEQPALLRERGERTCAAVYGRMYERLRVNIRELHPLLDEWMIAEGYGKVLGRPELDLPRRELCIVAACAATGQDRQLQSHLHGARNVGVGDGVIDDALTALAGTIDEPLVRRATALWHRVRHVVH